MIADYGARILAGGLIAAPASTAYAFGAGDFSVTALFETTQPGTLAACKPDHGQQGGAGWLLVLQPNGQIKFATDSGWGYYLAVSGPTVALDGNWHSVAAVRQSGQLLVYLDGQPLATTVHSTEATPINVSNSQRLTIGGCDQTGEPYRQFVGIIEDVTIWNRGISADDVWRTMFNKITPRDNGLVGFWEMNQNFADSSPTANTAQSTGSVGFAPVMHCLWAEAPNDYSYLAIDMHPGIADYGAEFGPGGIIAIPANPAYQFGQGDFAVTCNFASTSGGALVSSKSPSGGSGAYAGWLLILNNDGSLTFVTDNGYGYYLVNSVPTGALDGGLHSVAAIRQGGTLSIWFDGVAIQTSVLSSQPTPLNVSSNLRIVIGQADQPPTRQFVGVIEDVTLWNRAMTASEVQAARFATLAASTSGLVGYWPMDNNLADISATANPGSSSGAVGFVEVNTDHGAQIAAGGAIAIPSQQAYQFGTGDFAATCLFSTTASGALISSKSPSGGSGNYAGWLLILNADGSLTFATDNGYGYYLANSVATVALDGQWHSVAAVRTAGALAIWLDGVALQTSVLSTQPTPLNVSSNLRVLIGQTDQSPVRQFVGIVEDVTLWNRAITASEIQAVRFNALDETTSGLVGYWKMDSNLADASYLRNTAAAVGGVSFVPVAHLARRSQSLAVVSGTAYLYGCVLDKSMDVPTFPANTTLSVARPDGTLLNQSVSTDTLVVQMKGASVWAFCVKDPMPGDWTFAIQAPTDSLALVSVQTTPSTAIPATIETALTPLYTGGDIDHRYRSLSAASGLGWSWADLGAVVGVTLMTIGVAVLIPAVLGGAAITSAVVAGCAAAVGVGYLIAEVSLALQVEQGSFKISTGIGLPGPTFGGTGQGNVTLMLEGSNFLPALRDLLAAVAKGSFASGATAIPAKPSLQNSVTSVNTANKSVSLLLWDEYDAEHIIENNYYLSKMLRDNVAPGPFTNAGTRDALKALKNVDVRLESYQVFGSRRWINSQHQKVAIACVGGVKVALVGGLNILGGYWDTPTHPMTSTIHSWHDAAVLVQGPAVDVIEAEFDRRWRKNRGVPTKTGDYAKLAYWMADQKCCLDNPSACSSGTGPVVPYQNRATGGAQYPVDILITNSEYASRTTQIRDKLIAKIQAATTWAYFENYTFHDVQIMRALIAKLGSTSTFNVVVMIPHPTNGLEGWMDAGQFALCRASLVALMLCGAEWTQLSYKTPTGTVTVARSACSGTPAVTLPIDTPIEVGSFSYVLAADGSSHMVSLLDITDVQQTASARVIAASPARFINGVPVNPDDELPGLNINFRAIYVHSKLAVFDANYAIVGSANFAARSMAADGECSIGVADPTTVASIRQSVISHWGVNPATNNWKAAMQAFAASTSNGFGAVPLTIAALSIADPKGTEWEYLTSVIDPSYLL